MCIPSSLTRRGTTSPWQARKCGRSIVEVAFASGINSLPKQHLLKCFLSHFWVFMWFGDRRESCWRWPGRTSKQWPREDKTKGSREVGCVCQHRLTQQDWRQGKAAPAVLLSNFCPHFYTQQDVTNWNETQLELLFWSISKRHWNMDSKVRIVPSSVTNSQDSR